MVQLCTVEGVREQHVSDAQTLVTLSIVNVEFECARLGRSSEGRYNKLWETIVSSASDAIRMSMEPTCGYITKSAMKEERRAKSANRPFTIM